MNIEEAIQKLKILELKEFRKKRKFDLKESEVAFFTVINELDEKDKKIEEAYREGYRKGVQPQVFNNWKAENARIIKIKEIEDKKDKVIDMMAEILVNIGFYDTEFHFENDTEKEGKEQVKEYFYKLAEGNIDKK